MPYCKYVHRWFIQRGGAWALNGSPKPMSVDLVSGRAVVP